MKVLVFVKYFLVFWIVKPIQLGPNIQNPLSRMNQIRDMNQINPNSKEPCQPNGPPYEPN